MKIFAGKTILIFTMTLSSITYAANCLPPREFIASPANNGGAYLRVHPTGDYVLYTGGRTSNVEIIDFTKTNDSGAIAPVIIKTPMKNEAYPVEGRWDLIASPYDIKGMSYYSFADFTSAAVENKLTVEPVFSDRTHNQFYHSSAELPGGKKGNYDFRTTLWMDRWTQDYSVSIDAAGKREIKTKGARYQICENLFAPLKIAGVTEVADIRTQMAGLSNEYLNLQNTSTPAVLARRQEIQTLLSPLQQRLAHLVPSLNQLTLSKDGTMLAGIPSNKSTTHVYKIKENGECELVKDLGIRTSKVSFSYPYKNELPMVTYNAEGNAANNYVRGVYLYDLQTDKSFPISTAAAESASYPGFTKDGRIIYKAIDADRKAGFVRADAVSIVTNGAKCATKASASTPETQKKYENNDPSRFTQ
ncbi:MAG: hypothetical protein H7061_04945 [Bdellovibrionaceae bacterium]|nr:hypothetical protein [Bdellovibrio sp.]